MELHSASIYTDMDGLTALKARAADDAQGNLDEVARQFESLFVQQMLKSMRQANLGEGALDNDQSLFYRDLYDQQLAVHLSEQGGIGLADVIKRQLGDQSSNGEGVTSHSDIGRSIDDYRKMSIRVHRDAGSMMKSPSPSAPEGESVAPAQPMPVDGHEWSPQQFVQELWPWATEAAGMLGLKPQALLAQAALETGWGRHQIRRPDGDPANNLFGIKADSRWSGDRAGVTTLEYEQGQAIKKRAQFRAYPSPRESFQDYVAFVTSNPRYSKALQSTADSEAYFTELQRAGYATDPNYAKKIKAVMHGSEMKNALDRLQTEVPRSL